MRVPQPMPQYPIFSRPSMKTFSHFTPQFSSSSQIAMGKTFVKEKYQDNFTEGGFTEGDQT